MGLGMDISKGQSIHALSRGRRISRSASVRVRLAWGKALVDDVLWTLLWPLHNYQFDCWHVLHKSTSTGLQFARNQACCETSQCLIAISNGGSLPVVVPGFLLGIATTCVA